MRKSTLTKLSQRAPTLKSPNVSILSIKQKPQICRSVGMRFCRRQFEALVTGLMFVVLPSESAHAEPEQAVSNNVLADLRIIRDKKIGDYYTENSDSSAARKRIQADMDIVRNEGEALGVYESSPEFEAWWKKTPLTDAQLRAMDYVPVPEVVSLLYLNYANEHATEIDRASGIKRKPGVPSKGDQDFANKVETSQHSSIGQWLTKGSTLAGAAAIATGLFILKKLDDTFLFGTLSQITNAALEPLIRPVRERIEQLSNTYLAPRCIGWAQFVNGESRRRSKALAESKAGKELTGDAERYKHPSVSVEDFAKDHADFYSEFMQADYRWRGWMPAEFIRARNTGFDLLYSQWTSLAERISAYESNANSIATRIEAASRPELQRGGATVDELDEFSRLLNHKQEILVFTSLHDPEIPKIDEQLKTIIHGWQDRGIVDVKIEDFYQLTIDAFVAKTRPSFGLAAMLDNERFFQENNIALKGLNKIHAWQELGREMIGYYESLQKYREPIERFFARKGVKYDVGARIAERGFPLGGAARPPGTPSILSCKDLLKARVR
jgi:hypothetical protein